MRKNLIVLGVIAISSCLLLGCAEINDESHVSATTTNNEQKVDESETVEELIKDSTIIEETTSNEEPELSVDIESVIEITEEEKETSEVVEIEEQDVITELDKVMYASNAVNLRSGNSTAYEIVGGLVQNQEVHVIGQSAETGWYLIEYGETTAYVSNNYLSDTKVEVVQVEENVPVNNQEIVQNVPQNVGEGYIEVQLWDYTPENGAYFKEKFNMPVEECIQWVMDTTGATREVAEDSVRSNIEIRKKNPNFPVYTIHTEALVNHNGGKERYWIWQ